MIDKTIDLDLCKEKEHSLVIISKPGINSTKNNRSYLTLKDGDYSLKININNSIDNKIDQEKILKTISDIRNNIKGEKNKKAKNKLKKSSKLIINNNDNIDNEINNKNINEKNNSEKKSKNKKFIGNLINEKDSINKENIENTQMNKNNNGNKEFSSIIIADENKLTENNNDLDKENLKDIEENFASSINKKSVRTQFNKKDRQKSIQQSDKAEISKVNSESDNVTEFDNKIKMLVKYRFDNGQSIKGDINEKEEFESDLIDNNKDLITVLNNNKKNSEKEEKILFKQDTITIKKNNFLDDEKHQKSEHNENNEQNKDNIKENNNKIDLIEISKDNKLSNEGSIVNNDNISENKKLMPLISPSTVKKNNIGENKDKDKHKTKKLKIKSKPVIVRPKANNVSNSIGITPNKNINEKSSNRALYRSLQFTQKNCFICEKSFYLAKLYCADCGIHYLCRKCVKNYYEDFIEKKNNCKILKCPSAKCEKTIDYDILKTILSENHQQIFENENENDLVNNNLLLNSLKLSSDKIDNNVKMYSERHVLDISSNMNFFMFKKAKDIFCPNCLKPDLFSKSNNQFIKCLNCNYKICKYCLKEYTPKHLDIKVEGYCKVYFRNENDFIEKKNYILIYLLQLFFVVSMYYLTFVGTYLFFYDKLRTKLRLDKRKRNIIYYIKKIFIIIFSSIFLMICCPFIIICYPFFPVLIALFDY